MKLRKIVSVLMICLCVSASPSYAYSDINASEYPYIARAGDMFLFNTDGPNGTFSRSIPLLKKDLDLALTFLGPEYTYRQNFHQPQESSADKEPVSRGYVANELRKLAEQYGISISHNNSAGLFTDYGLMDQYTRDSVSFLTEHGVFGALSDGSFGYAESMTRDDGAQICISFYDHVLLPAGILHPKGNYIFINGIAAAMARISSPSPIKGDYIGLYGDRLIVGYYTASPEDQKRSMPEGMVFSTQINNTRQDYAIVKTVSFPREILLSSFGGELGICQDLYNACYEGRQYDLAIMMYGKDPMADPRVVVFANKCR